ncbi:MAG: lysophospholipase [Candidatus Odinarchaeota archaeon]|nr:lysophospholipase [Candidatus Odinarchaeota archaeon]
MSVSHEEGYLDTFDGLKLYYEKWVVESPKSTIVVVPGFAEHSGRYYHVAEFFSNNGFNVYVLNNRGHGKSEGERAFVNNFDDFIEDLKRFVEHVKKENNIEKVFLLGHSMGGLIVLRYGLKYPDDLIGIISSGAALKVSANVSPIVKAMAGILSKVMPKMKVKGSVDPNFLTHDKEIVNKYINDPYVFKFVTARLGAEMMSKGNDTLKNAVKFKVPLLALAGEEDRLVDISGVKEFYESAASEDKKLVIYPGMYHEIFNEIEKEKVFNDVLDWLNSHI